MNLRSKYLVSIANQVAQVGSLVAIMVVVARTLGPEGKGQVTLVLAVANMAAAITLLSLQTGSVYFATRERIPLGVLAANGVAYCVLVGLPVVSLMWVYRAEGASLLRLPQDARLEIWVAALLLPSYFIELGAGLLVGARRFGRLAVVNGGAGIVFVLLFGMCLMGSHGTVRTACGLFLGYRVVRSLALWGAIPWRAGGRVWPDAGVFRRTLRYSLQGHLGTVLQAFVYRVDLLLVNAFLGAAAAGLYAAATLFAHLLGQVPSALGVVVLPEVAAREADTGHVLASRVSRQTLWMTAGTGLLLAFAAPVLVPAVFGAEFRPAIVPLWYLLPGVLAIAVSRILYPAISGGGRPWVGSCGAALALMLTVGGNVLLIPRWGLAGAAVATSIAYIAQGLLALGMFRRLTHVPVTDLLALRRSDFQPAYDAIRRRGGG